MTALLQTIDLCCERNDRPLVDNLNLVVEPGGIYRIEGPNGSGKTTLLRVLSGLSGRYSGQILWRGQPIRRVRTDFLTTLLFIGHQPGIKSVLTPRENLRWYQATHSHGAAVGSQAIDAALEKAGLYGFEDAPCFTLSAGQQRRVGLARLFLSPSDLWILDEPFTAIDRQGVAELEGWIAEQAGSGGSVILTTHHELSLDQPVQSIALGGLDGGF